MSSQWKKGTLLWFDFESGEGLVGSDEGKSYFLHISSFYESGKYSRKSTIDDNTKIIFTTYENSMTEMVDRIEILQNEIVCSEEASQ